MTETPGGAAQEAGSLPQRLQELLAKSAGIQRWTKLAKQQDIHDQKVYTLRLSRHHHHRHRAQVCIALAAAHDHCVIPEVGRR